MKSFENAFLGKSYELSEKLDVSLPLLLLLFDNKLLNKPQVELLKVVKTASEKVFELLDALCKRPDAEFDVFCSILRSVNQAHIVEILEQDVMPIHLNTSKHVTGPPSVSEPREKLGLTVNSEKDKDLEETIEVDYGLPVVLRSQNVLTLREFQEIEQHQDSHRRLVQERVSLLLEFAVNKLKGENENMWSALKNTNFRDSLHKTNQLHIANYIMADGVIDPSRFGDVCPLNEQQRSSLLPIPDVTEDRTLNSQDHHRTLLGKLLDEEVISCSQSEYISANVPPSESNKRLLWIMQRKSVADVKKFCRCLLEIECKNVVERLNKSGVIVPIHTSINSETMTNEEKREKENWFVTNFKWIRPKAIEAFSCLLKRGCELIYAASQQSIAWYIHCQTQDSLDSLRLMYDSNELAQVLHVIFNSGWRHLEQIPLRLEWRAGNYEFDEVSSRPFETLLDALSMLDAVPLDVLELVLLKAYALFYNVQSVSVTILPSSDVAKRGAILQSVDVTTHITLSSVCSRWWKLITRPDWKIRKQWLVIRLSAGMTHQESLPLLPGEEEMMRESVVAGGPSVMKSAKGMKSTAPSPANIRSTPSPATSMKPSPMLSSNKPVPLLPSTGAAVASQATSSSSSLQAALKSVSIAPSVDLTVDLEAPHISVDQQIPGESEPVSELSNPRGSVSSKVSDEPHLVYGEHVSGDRSLKRRLEDFEPVQPTKRLTPSTEINDSSHHMDYNAAISVSSQLSKDYILLVPLGKPCDALPWEMVEMIVIKAAIVFHQVYRVRLVPRADVQTYVTVCSVCEDWHTIMMYRDYNRRQLRQLFQRKLTGAVPLELLKAAVLLRRLIINDTSTSKPPKSVRDDVSTAESLMFDPDFSLQEKLTYDHDADRKVLILLSSVCRHWCTTIKKRNHLSRQQLCLMLHDDCMRRMTRQLHKNRVEVTASLCVTDDLINKIVISDRQKKHLLTSPLSRRSSRLMNMMQLKNVQEYKLFIGVLRRTAREDIAVLLESTHVISSSDRLDDLTIMNDELFVLRGGRKIIEVYSTTTFEKLRTFDVSKYLSDHWAMYCLLTSCNINRCLYLSDWGQRTVCKIDSTGNELMSWEVNDRPRGLCVSKSSNIIVTCSDDTIREYSPSGSLVNTVHLPSEVKDAIHAVDLSNGHYAVIHWEPVHGVSVVNKQGRVIHTYRNDPQSNTRLLDGPYQLAVTSNDTIIVADSGNDRIISLNATLNCGYDMSLLLDNELHQPHCVYYDESRSRLYVGEGTGRVVVFEGISDILTVNERSIM